LFSLFPAKPKRRNDRLGKAKVTLFVGVGNTRKNSIYAVITSVVIAFAFVMLASDILNDSFFSFLAGQKTQPV
jgi:hypothetical protein